MLAILPAPSPFVRAMQEASGWEPAGHAEGFGWATSFQSVAPWLFAALIALLVARAWRNRGHYRAVGALDQAAVERVRDAVARAEQATIGEVAVVVLERSDRHLQGPWRGAVVLTALATLAFWAPLERAALPLPLLTLAQLLFGAAAFALVRSIPDLQRLFVANSRAAEVAEEQAIQEFHALGLRDTAERTGVLLFVSLFERRIVVLGDEGIAKRVDPEQWVEVDRVILEEARHGRLEQGLVQGVTLVGKELAALFPAEPGEKNQVADHVVIRRE